MGISSKIPERIRDTPKEKKCMPVYEKRICTGIVIFKYEESCINKTVFLQKYQYVLIFYVFLFYYTTIYIYI